jgi:nitronate monooxygenase
VRLPRLKPKGRFAGARIGRNEIIRPDFSRRLLSKVVAEERTLDLQPARMRAMTFCRRYGLQAPILQAPMAGSCPASLAAAVANAGGMGALRALLSSPEGVAEWVAEFRLQSEGPFQLNLWIPEPVPARDPDAEKLVREFLAKWGPPVPPEASNVRPLAKY